MAQNPAAWFQLRDLLRREALLLPRPGRPILTRSGHKMAWLLYTLPLAMTKAGSDLLGECLISELNWFSARQIAARGFGALPLMMSCVAVGGGEWTGIAVRDQRKRYGSTFLVDGGDRSKPVVVVDDSVVSGTSLYATITALEAEGFSVEGCVALVRFPGRGGTEWATSCGYAVRHVFDLWQDLDFPAPARPRWCSPPRSRPEAGEFAGSNPADFAQAAQAQFASAGTVPRAVRLSADPASCAGGVFVSVREAGGSRRLSRQGVINVDVKADGAGLARSIAAVSADVAVDLARVRSPGAADDRGFAVTLFGGLQQITPGMIDSTRYGLVVLNDAETWRAGAALPNTERAGSDIEQYLEARRKAAVQESTPHRLFRHTVSKYVSAGAVWPAFGAPALPRSDEWEQAVQQIISRVRSLLYDADQAGSEPDPAAWQAVIDRARPRICSIGVALYASGKLLGSWIASAAKGPAAVPAAVEGARSDRRFGPQPRSLPSGTTAVVSILHSPRVLRGLTHEDLAADFRLGVDTVSVRADGGPSATILAYVAVQQGWSARELLTATVRKAGIEATAGRWTAYQTEARVIARDGPDVTLVAGPRAVGFGVREDDRPARLLADHLVALLAPDGLPHYSYDPVKDVVTRPGSAARKILGLRALADAGAVLDEEPYLSAARNGLARYAGHVREQGLGAEIFLLLALQESGLATGETAPGGALVTSLLASFRPEGFVASCDQPAFRSQDHAVIAGAALLACTSLASHATPGGPEPADIFSRAFPWYSRRFASRPSWGLVGWHTQAWSRAFLLTGREEYADFAFRMADYATDRQLQTSGAYLTDLWRLGPSFHTAYIAEGILDAYSLAKARGDTCRAERYAGSWREAMRFMASLVVRERDTFCMPRPEIAVGGVRHSHLNYVLRVDFNGHYLTALSRGMALGL